MAAENNLSSQQWEQLDMFRPAKELRHNTILGDVEDAKLWDYGRTDPEVLDNQTMSAKLAESKMFGLYDSIKEKGVQNPIYISRKGSKPVIKDGHHRVAAANDIDPNMLIPVEHGR